MSNVQHTMLRQTEAAKRLIADLAREGEADDATLVADTIEGETGLLEAIDAALAEIDECEVMITGLRSKENDFSGRRASIEKRADRIRALIEQAMIATEQLSLRLPTATITLRKTKPGLQVTAEADIPASYWIEQERPAPKLDKKAVLAALESKKQVPGATLDNGSYTLSVRRK